MAIWKKIPTDILPQRSFETISVTLTPKELRLILTTKDNDDLNVGVLISRSELVAFEWCDEVFDIIQTSTPSTPWPKLNDITSDTYPYLEVLDSEWTGPLGVLPYPEIKHFKFLSGSEAVDVLCCEYPTFRKLAD